MSAVDRAAAPSERYWEKPEGAPINLALDDPAPAAPTVPPVEPVFRALPARRGFEIASRIGVVWATCRRPDYAFVIATLLSECSRERLARLLAEGEKR